MHKILLNQGIRKSYGHKALLWLCALIGLSSTAMSTNAAEGDPLTGVTRIGAGYTHSCAIVSGAAKCWGDNDYGQLGDGSTLESGAPVQVVGLTSGVTAISAGLYHACAVVNGAAKCWGRNYYGQLGDGSVIDSSTPVQVAGLTTGVTAIEVGKFHTCAIVYSAAKCWGENGNGQLGIGSTADKSTPAQVTGLSSNVTAISAGDYHTCVRIGGGTAKCWGYNYSGQLGNGLTTESYVPVQVAGLTGVSSISAGAAHTCAIASGAAKCWGLNSYGQLGNGLTTDSTTLVQVTGITSGATAISAAYSHTCAIVSGAAKCWGENDYAQLGNRSNVANDSSIPVQVMGLTSGVTAISAGDLHACAIVSGGAAKCWGGNIFGQLGNGSIAYSRSTPVQVTGLTSGNTAISAGYAYGCATVSGAAKCWGDNDYGQLGNGSTTDSPTPIQVTGLTAGVTAIDAGFSHSCAVVSGAAMCWGDNERGQLGNGSITDRITPVQVKGLTSGVSAISAGDRYSCAIVNGAAKCWGDNQYGQLGNGSIGTFSSTPVLVAGATSGVTAISAGEIHTCAVVLGAAKCWGNNGSSTNPTPVQITGLTSGVTAVSAGYLHSCAVVSGAAKCWGGNDSGELGNGSDHNGGSSIPVQVLGLTSGVTAIGAGDSFTCAVVSGAAKCWGANNAGQLGVEPTENNITAPIQVTGLTSGVTMISAGYVHGCATVSGAANCWGDNSHGQLGYPLYADAPVNVVQGE